MRSLQNFRQWSWFKRVSLALVVVTTCLLPTWPLRLELLFWLALAAAAWHLVLRFRRPWLSTICTIVTVLAALAAVLTIVSGIGFVPASGGQHPVVHNPSNQAHDVKLVITSK